MRVLPLYHIVTNVKALKVLKKKKKKKGVGEPYLSLPWVVSVITNPSTLKFMQSTVICTGQYHVYSTLYYENTPIVKAVSENNRSFYRNSCICGHENAQYAHIQHSYHNISMYSHVSHDIRDSTVTLHHRVHLC